MTAPGFSANIRICLKCESLVWWHLKPFSSLHCFWHISQYHRSFCKPFALMRFEIAFGEKKSCLGMVVVAAAGVLRRLHSSLRAVSLRDAMTPVTWNDKPCSGSASVKRIACYCLEAAAVEDN